MPEKKRTTTPSTTPLPVVPRRPVRRKIEEQIAPLPTPVMEGPVEPPKAPPSWWAWLLIGFFSASTIAIVGYVFIARPFAPVPPASDDQTAVEDPEDKPTPPAYYSYNSVVAPVAQADHYTETAADCDVPQDVSEVPITAALTQLIVAVEVPGEQSLREALPVLELL